jgi:hypothetical protein
MDLSVTPQATGFRVQPRSALGLLWLQTHFEPQTWDLICEGRVRLSAASIHPLCADAVAAGLELQGVPALSAS